MDESVARAIRALHDLEHEAVAYKNTRDAQHTIVAARHIRSILSGTADKGEGS